jgi:hypothetical protein
VRPHLSNRQLTSAIGKALVEIAFIIFLFYANLLMGEFTRHSGAHKTLLIALEDIITLKTFAIALATAIIGYFAFEHLRKRL